MTATTMPADLAEGRKLFLASTGLPGVDIGALPDPAHKSGGGYHCGCQDIKNIGKWGSAFFSTADYSVRQSRDRIGGNTCSAIDVGDNWPNGGRAAWIRFNNLLVAQMRAGDPDLVALRAVNFSPDGKQRKRYDSNSPANGIIASNDTVDGHTHLEWWRNTAGTAARGISIHRINALMLQAIRGGTTPLPTNPGVTMALTDTQMDDLYRRVANIDKVLWYTFVLGQDASTEPLYVGSIGKGTAGLAPQPVALAKRINELYARPAAQITPTAEQWESFTQAVEAKLELMFQSKVGEAVEAALESVLPRIQVAVAPEGS